MDTQKPIILIDDDAEDLELLQLAVKDTGCKHPVLCFTDPVKALAYFTAHKSEALFILCDLNMPKMTGLQLKQQLMTAELPCRHISFYVFSTGNTSRDREIAAGLDLAGYFVKPASYTGIKDLLQNIIETEQRKT